MVLEASRPDAERSVIEQVLRAERDAERAVATARLDAERILTEARERCQRIHALADKRISALHSRCGERTDRAIAALHVEHERELMENAAHERAEGRVQMATAHTADWLLGTDSDRRPGVAGRAS